MARISAVGQILLSFLGPSAAALLLKPAMPVSFRITLLAADVAPVFTSPGSSSVYLSLASQTSGRALLGMTPPSYKGWVGN